MVISYHIILQQNHETHTICIRIKLRWTIQSSWFSVNWKRLNLRLRHPSSKEPQIFSLHFGRWHEKPPHHFDTGIDTTVISTVFIIKLFGENSVNCQPKVFSHKTWYANPNYCKLANHSSIQCFPLMQVMSTEPVDASLQMEKKS